MSQDAGGPAPAAVVGFVSPSRAAGRTSVAANLAAVLRAAGQRVLVLDWATEGSHIHDYLGPFHIDTVRAEDLLGRDLGQLLSKLFEPEAGVHASIADPPSFAEIRRYELPIGTGWIDMVAPAHGGGAPQLARLGPSSGTITRLRSLLRVAGWDDILVDTPTDVSDEAIEQLALLCDVAVVCFGPQPRVVRAAGKLADNLRARAEAGIRIVPVSSRIDFSDPTGVQRIRDEVRRVFGGTIQPGETLDRNVIEVPYRSHAAYEVLAVLLEELGPQSGVLPAYEQLAMTVTRLDRLPLPPVPAVTQSRYRRILGREPAQAADEEVFIAYAPEDRLWKDWVQGELEAAGATVRQLPGDESWLDGDPLPSLVLIVSPHLPSSFVAQALAGIARVTDERAAAAARLDVLGVQVAGSGPVDLPLPVTKELDVGRLAYQPARARLLAHFELVDQSTTADRPARRFPGGSHDRATVMLPGRNVAFVGRAEPLEALRDHFTGPPADRPLMLHGPAGVGKSDIALEYGHRFATDYDVVCWIAAHDRQSVRARLAHLADTMGVAATGDAALSAVRALESGSAGRWLVVYDDADDPSVLDGLVPDSRTGHVLVTSRRGDPTGAAPGIEVGRLDRDESIALLRHDVRYLTVDDADQVATAVGRVPLALWQAAGWLTQAASAVKEAAGDTDAVAVSWSAKELVARLDREPVASPAELDGCDPVAASLARVLHLLIGTLRATPLGRLTIGLAEFLGFLAPIVDYRVLSSRAVLTQLARATGGDGEILLSDFREFDRILWQGVSHRLFEVDWSHEPQVRMHRTVQALVRGTLPSDIRRQRQSQAAAGLAGYAPTDAGEDVPDRQVVLARLHGHLAPSGALESDDREVRRWVVNHTRYLYSAGDSDAWRSGVETVRAVLDRWTAVFGRSDPLRLRLAGQLANLHRALGQEAAAYGLSQEILDEQVRSLGTDHPRTLITRRGLAADLRGAGDFDGAYNEDGTAWRGLRHAYGDDHPHTLRAAHNLAISLYFQGNVHGALKREEDVLARRERLYGWDDPSTWNAACDVGTYRRELGRYDSARKVLVDALRHAGQQHTSSHPQALRLIRSLAVTKRRQRGSINLAAALEEDKEALRHYRDIYGEEHPSTRACMLSLAADYHVTGNHLAAVRLADDCLRYLVDTSGSDHPFTNLCRINLGLFLRSVGSYDRARSVGEEALTCLRQLGTTHPWTVAAEIDYAGTLLASGDVAAAAAHDESAHVTAREYLGRDHPYTLAAARNLAAAHRPPDTVLGDADWVERQDLDVDIPEI